MTDTTGEEWMEGKTEQTLEADQSVTIKGYYKGFSVLITKRKHDAKILPLIEDAMIAINYMITKEFKPSWNEDTNEQVSQPTNLGTCPKCGAPMKISKAGKQYCSALCWKQ
jgi:hypothetical protein